MSEYSDQRRNFRSFVHRENLLHFTRILESEADLAKRKIIQELILEHYESCLKPDEGDRTRRPWARRGDVAEA